MVPPLPRRASRVLATGTPALPSRWSTSNRRALPWRTGFRHGMTSGDAAPASPALRISAMKKFLLASCAGLLASCLFASGAHATVVIGGTRVVFPARVGELTVRLSFVGGTPALVESWLGRGGPK